MILQIKVIRWCILAQTYWQVCSYEEVIWVRPAGCWHRSSEPLVSFAAPTSVGCWFGGAAIVMIFFYIRGSRRSGSAALAVFRDWDSMGTHPLLLKSSWRTAATRWGLWCASCGGCMATWLMKPVHNSENVYILVCLFFERNQVAVRWTLRAWC